MESGLPFFHAVAVEHKVGFALITAVPMVVLSTSTADLAKVMTYIQDTMSFRKLLALTNTRRTLQITANSCVTFPNKARASSLLLVSNNLELFVCSKPSPAILTPPQPDEKQRANLHSYQDLPHTSLLLTITVFLLLRTTHHGSKSASRTRPQIRQL